MKFRSNQPDSYSYHYYWHMYLYHMYTSLDSLYRRFHAYILATRKSNNVLT